MILSASSLSSLRLCGERLPAVRPLLVGLVLVSTAACGYSIGSVYRADFRTLAVPVFGNDTFRRGYEFELTDAVARQIIARTPYVLCDEGSAEAVLRGKILSYNQPTVVDDETNQVLKGRISVVLSITLVDRRSGQVLFEKRDFSQQADFDIPRGENEESARRETFENLAERIVHLLKSEW